MGCVQCCEKLFFAKTKSKKPLQVEVDDVATPYAGKLEPLSTGDVITIQGFIHSECER